MLTRSIVIDRSMTVQTITQEEVDVIRISSGLFQIDNFWAKEVFVLASDKVILFACGVSYVEPKEGQRKGDWVCRFEIDPEILTELMPPTPGMVTPRASQDSQATVPF